MYRLAAVLTLSLALAVHGYAQQFDGAAQPADVLLAIERLADDVEEVRVYMGKPAVELGRFQVEFAAPRHVYYQAQTLFRKLNRLGSEVAGLTRQIPPPAPEGDVVPDDVLRMVAHAQQQLDSVRREIGLAPRSAVYKRDPRTEPRDVFEAIVQTNRQVNLMIDDRFRPADVHTQLSLAYAYLGGVLTSLRKEEPFPEVDFVPNKQPVDVYDALVDALELNQQVGEKLDLPVLEITARRLKRDRSILSDNYDVATMLVSDIAF